MSDLRASLLFWEQRLRISVCLCPVCEQRGSSGSSQALPPLLLLIQLLDPLLLCQGIGLPLLSALLLPLLLALVLLGCACFQTVICRHVGMLAQSMGEAGGWWGQL